MSRSKLYDLLCVSTAIREVVAANLNIQKREAWKWYQTSSVARNCRTRAEYRNDALIIRSSVDPTASSTLTPLNVAKKQSKGMKKKSGQDLGKREYSTDSKKRTAIGEAQKPDFVMDSSPVPSSRLERLFHYGSLATGMGLGALSEGIRRLGQDGTTNQSLFLNPANLERLVKKLSQMRGAALKIGQLLSFQDQKVFPPEIQKVMTRVQNTANFMPRGQLERVMSKEFGNNWRTQIFSTFDDYPIAAASIGQVHNAVLLKDYAPVAIKIQYPGVANSIDSDLNNLMLLLTASRFLPEGLFLDKTIANARTELKWECDYLREAQNMETFQELLKDDEAFAIPKVYHNVSTESALTMERMWGTEITKGDWDQETKDWIATNVMRLCLLEIAKFKFMQTDPNWANFLYNDKTGKIELLDFGAARGYGDAFIDTYLEILRAAVRQDREACKEYSLNIGYLTGLESQAMLEAHVDSIIVLGEPFRKSEETDQFFDFSSQTITDRVRGNISLMLRERLAPPPEETYGLHRKLSGAFLLCARLNAKVPCAKLFEEIVGI